MTELSCNEQQAISRCEYACKLLADSNIKYEVKKKEIGHINLYLNDKVVMSFWARTGKFVFHGFTQEQETKRNKLVLDDDRGIKNCIKAFNWCFKK